jgi:hypothetical protein
MDQVVYTATVDFRRFPTTDEGPYDGQAASQLSLQLQRQNARAFRIRS